MVVCLYLLTCGTLLLFCGAFYAGFLFRLFLMAFLYLSLIHIYINLLLSKKIDVEGGIKAKKYLEMWFYCEDASALTSDSMVVINRNGSDLKLKLPVEKLTNGWNRLHLSLILAIEKYDGIDAIKINLATGGKAQKFMMDDIVLAPVTLSLIHI